MIRKLIASARDHRKMMHLSVRLLAGRKFYLAPLLPLLWSAALAFALLVGWDTSGYTASNAQTSLMGLPLTVLAVLLGVRIISGEVDRRTLEIAYTVPGGAHRDPAQGQDRIRFQVVVGQRKTRRAGARRVLRFGRQVRTDFSEVG